MANYELELKHRRTLTARQICARTAYKHSDVLEILERLGVHGNWTLEELWNRPSDYEELTEIVIEEMEENNR